MAANTLPRDYDIARILADYRRRISFLERRLQGLFGSATPQNVATQACRVTRSSNYSVPHATTEVIPFNDEVRSEEHTSELQSLMRNSYAVFCLKKQKNIQHIYI